MSQREYLQHPPKFIAGMDPDDALSQDDASHNAESGTTSLYFGTFVKRGTSGVGSKRIAGSTDYPYGVLMFKHTYDIRRELHADTGGPLPGVDIEVRRWGRAAMRCEGSPTPGSKVHMRHTSGAGGTVLGAVRADAVAGETMDLTGMAEFVTAAENGFAVVEFNCVAGLPSTINSALLGAPSFSIAAEDSDAIAVSVQMKDRNGTNVAARQRFTWRLADAANGAPSADPPSGGTAVTTGTALKEHTAEVFGEAETDATGLAVLTLTEAGVDTWYLRVDVGGATYASGAITFA
jgi:hypothetical protein